MQVSGLAALAACHYLPDVREKIFTVLYKAINSPIKELQEAGKDAMKKVSELRLVALIHRYEISNGYVRRYVGGPTQFNSSMGGHRLETN